MPPRVSPFLPFPRRYRLWPDILEYASKDAYDVSTRNGEFEHDKLLRRFQRRALCDQPNPALIDSIISMPHTLSIFLLATQWGPGVGGPNILNFYLARALAKLPGVEVICVTPSKALVPGENVKLMDLGKTKQFAHFDERDDVALVRLVKADVERVDFSLFVGHDVISGEKAKQCAEAFPSRALCAVVHHHSYETYGTVKGASQVKVDDYRENQKRCLSHADLVLAVGPFLMRSAKDLTGDKNVPITELVPGLFEDIGVRDKEPEFFRVFSHGRLEADDAVIKQTKLTIAAFARLSDQRPGESILLLYGLSDTPENKKAVEKVARKYGASRPNIRYLPFSEDREKLVRALAESSVVVMPSVREGFGLAAWEAISAGVPCILSRQSGAYKYLEGRGPDVSNLVRSFDVKGGWTDEPTDADVDCLTKELEDSRKYSGDEKRRAITLRKKLLSLDSSGPVTWDAAAKVVHGVARDRFRARFRLDGRGEVEVFRSSNVEPSRIDQLRDCMNTANEIAVTETIQSMRGDRRYVLRDIATLEELRSLWMIDCAAYGERAITFEQFVIQWESFPHFPKALFDGDLIAGAIGIMPITDSRIQAFIRGEISEADLQNYDLSGFFSGNVDVWLVDGIVRNPNYPMAVTAELLSASIVSWIEDKKVKFPALVYAIGQNRQGMNLIGRAGFELVVGPKVLPDGLPIYSIRFNTASDVFTWLFKRIHSHTRLGGPRRP